MVPTPNLFLRFLIAGRLNREFIISNSGKSYNNVPGGNLLYCAGGIGIWDTNCGLIGKYSPSYPTEKIELFSKSGFDIRGIVFSEAEFEDRAFYAYSNSEIIPLKESPISCYSRFGLEIPKTLLGYSPHLPSTQPLSLQDYSIRLSDIPVEYMDATAIHICPMDFASQGLILSKVQQTNINTVTLEISSEYMNSNSFELLQKLIKGTTAVITTEEKALALFTGRSTNLWEIAEGLASFGSNYSIISRGPSGQWLYIKDTHSRYIIPAYPSRIEDPTGAQDAFCGGFLYGYRSSYDPIEAALYGNVSYSLAIEGSNPEYPLETMPGLAQARLYSIRNSIQKF